MHLGHATCLRMGHGVFMIKGTSSPPRPANHVSVVILLMTKTSTDEKAQIATHPFQSGSVWYTPRLILININTPTNQGFSRVIE